MSTLGIDFGVTKLKTAKYDVKVNIFDLAGQPFFFEVYSYNLTKERETEVVPTPTSS